MKYLAVFVILMAIAMSGCSTLTAPTHQLQLPTVAVDQQSLTKAGPVTQTISPEEAARACGHDGLNSFNSSTGWFDCKQADLPILDIFYGVIGGVVLTKITSLLFRGIKVFHRKATSNENSLEEK